MFLKYIFCQHSRQTCVHIVVLVNQQGAVVDVPGYWRAAALLQPDGRTCRITRPLSVLCPRTFHRVRVLSPPYLLLKVGMTFSWTAAAVMRCEYTRLCARRSLSAFLPPPLCTLSQTHSLIPNFVQSLCPRITFGFSPAPETAVMPGWRRGCLWHR